MSTRRYARKKPSQYARAPAKPRNRPPPMPPRPSVGKAAYSGRGDYIKMPRAMRPSKNTTKSLGGSVGAYLGHGLQQVVKALTGFGDYEVLNNSLMPDKIGGDPPIIQNTVNNSHVVHHREFIGDVFASQAFSVTSFPINPGLLATFPWVSQQADSYEQYKFRGLVFEFKSMSSDAVLSTSASSALGTVIMSTQYNVLDAPFTDKRTMENYEYANSCKPSCSMLHPIECKMSQTSVSELYVRTGAITVGDLRLYDLGTFSIAVQGMQNAAANQVIGELWCSYELEFYKPKLLIGGGALISDHYNASFNPSVFGTGNPFGAQGQLPIRAGSNLGTVLQVAAVAPYGPNSIIFPQYLTDGIFLITYTITGSTAAATTPTYTAGGTTVNIDVVSTQVRIFNTGQSFTIAPQAGLAATGVVVVTVQQMVRIIQSSPGIAPGIQLLFSAGNLPGSGGTGTVDLVISQVNPQMT